MFICITAKEFNPTKLTSFPIMSLNFYLNSSVWLNAFNDLGLVCVDINIPKDMAVFCREMQVTLISALTCCLANSNTR